MSDRGRTSAASGGRARFPAPRPRHNAGRRREKRNNWLVLFKEVDYTDILIKRGDVPLESITRAYATGNVRVIRDRGVASV